MFIESYFRMEKNGGVMTTGQWILWKNQWYYMNGSGAMVTDTVIDGKYRVGSDGVWIE